MASKKKLDAAATGVFDKFFSTQGDSAEQVDDLPVREKKAAKKRVFSFRGNDSAVTEWRLYADAAGIKVDEFGTAAMTEYIENHPLNEDQKKIYDLKLKQKS